MAKKDQDENLIDVGQVYSKSEDFVNKNGKLFSYIIVGLLVLAAGYLLFKKVVLEPKVSEAENEIWKSEYYFAIDSTRLAIDGDEDYLGFYDIADEYSSTPSGNLARYYTGLINLREGEFEEAIANLQECSFANLILESQRLGNIGDAMVETGDVAGGIEYFKKALAHSDNEATAPIYLKKMGIAYQHLGQNEEALEAYRRLKADFSSSVEGSSIEKYIAQLEMAN